MLGRRGGVGPIGFFILMVFLIFMYPFTIGPTLSQAGQDAINNGHLTGLEAFGWANLNLWVILTIVLVIALYFYFGGQNG